MEALKPACWGMKMRGCDVTLSVRHSLSVGCQVIKRIWRASGPDGGQWGCRSVVPASRWLRLWCFGVEAVKIFEPVGHSGIGRHSPIASRTEGATTHLGTVGQAGALELLTEEALVEGAEPLQHHVGSVGTRALRCAEGAACQEVDLAGTERMA